MKAQYIGYKYPFIFGNVYDIKISHDMDTDYCIVNGGNGIRLTYYNRDEVEKDWKRIDG